MIKRERLSVIIPVRNGESTLEFALRSTLFALPHDAELILVDDRSTDATAEIVRGIKDPRVRYVPSEGPPGVAGALNFGIGIAEGGYLARMDADDFCLPWRFPVQFRALAAHDLDFIFTSSINFSGSAPWVLPSARADLRRIAPQHVPWLLLSRNVLAHNTMLCRRSALIALGGYQSTPAEDYDLWLRAASQGVPMMRVGFPTVAYRFHSEQLSRNQAWTDRALNDPILQHSIFDLALRLCLPYPEEWVRRRSPSETSDRERNTENEAYIQGRLSPKLGRGVRPQKAH